MLKHLNYYGFDHEKINKQFGGDLTYLGDTTVFGEYQPSAIYKAANPDRAKGHKDYMLLTKDGEFYVRGMEPEVFIHESIVSGVECNNCKDIIYSPHRHSMIYCSCQSVAIDGGKDYTIITGKDYKLCNIDLMTGEVKFET